MEGKGKLQRPKKCLYHIRPRKKSSHSKIGGGNRGKPSEEKRRRGGNGRQLRARMSEEVKERKGNQSSSPNVSRNRGGEGGQFNFAGREKRKGIFGAGKDATATYKVKKKKRIERSSRSVTGRMKLREERGLLPVYIPGET